MLRICHQYPFLVIPFYLHTFCRSQRSTKTEQRNVSHAAESLTGPRDVLHVLVTCIYQFFTTSYIVLQIMQGETKLKYV